MPDKAKKPSRLYIAIAGIWARRNFRENAWYRTDSPFDKKMSEIGYARVDKNWRINLVRTSLLLLMTTLSLAPNTAAGQTPEPMAPFKEDGSFGLDPLLFTPGVHVYFTERPDPGEINPYPLGLGLEWAGIDLVKYHNEGELRYGMGTSFASLMVDDDHAAAIRISGFLQIGGHSRLSVGYLHVRAPGKVTPGSRDNSAFFIGMSFPTQISEAFR